MSELIVSSAKDALVWLVLLISGASSLDMSEPDCHSCMDRFLPGATAEELVMVLQHDDAAVEQLVAPLAADDYPTRLHAERLLTAMGPDALPLLDKARDDSDDPHTRFVLERVMNNIGKPSVARQQTIVTMLALRLLDPQSPDYDAILRAQLSDKNYFVEKLALDEMMRRRKTAATPTVLKYMQKVSPAFSAQRPGRMAAIYRWLGDEALSGKDSGAIRNALLAEVERARGAAVPALVEAVSRRASRPELAATLAKIVARDNRAAETIRRFAEEVSGEKIAAKALGAWLESDKNFAEVPAAKWDGALAALADAMRLARKAAERGEMDNLLAPDTFLTACLDLDELRGGDLHARWLAELFGQPNYTLQDKIVDLLAIDGGVEINRLYISASDQTAIDKTLLIGLLAGNIDIARLRKTIQEGCVLLTLKGEFDAKALNISLAKHVGVLTLKQGARDIYAAQGMSLCILDDSTILIGLGKGLPEFARRILQIGTVGAGPISGRRIHYQSNNGSKALLEALDRLDAEARPQPTVRFSEEGGIFRATLHRSGPNPQAPPAKEGEAAPAFTILRAQLRLREDSGLRAEIKFQCADDAQALAFADNCKAMTALLGAGKVLAKITDKVFNDIFADANIMVAGSEVTIDVKVPSKVCDGVIRFFSSNPVEKYSTDETEEPKEQEDSTPFSKIPTRPRQLPGSEQKQPPVKQAPGGN